MTQKGRPPKEPALKGCTPGLAELLVAVAGLVTEFDLDAHEAVVLGDTEGLG